MNDSSDQGISLEDTLAEGIAAVMAATDLDEAETDLEVGEDTAEDMADLFLSELNRLWADPAPLVLG
jgi:hypothetical protein